MRIKDDKQFNTLMHRYAQRYFYDDAREHQKELLDYIDEYVSLQIYLEEFPSGISYEEGLKKMPEWQRELNQRLAKALQIINEEEKNENT